MDSGVLYKNNLHIPIMGYDHTSVSCCLEIRMIEHTDNKMMLYNRPCDQLACN